MIGIDLGTSSSSVAVMEGGVPQVIPSQKGARSTPSVVSFGPDGEPLVGQIARRQALGNPKGTVFGVKRLIGRKLDSPECEALQRFAPFDIVAAPNGDAHIRVGERVYSPPEISAFVLEKLKAAAEDYLGEPVEDAIVTVPAYFNDVQRQATKDAGLIAGLKVSHILNEPTAAALTHGLKNTGKEGRFVAVYDLGGGTFDVTILELADGLFQVRATGGNTFLGGDDFDERIMAWLLSECRRELGLRFQVTPQMLVRLREAAEKAKRDLADADETQIVAPFLLEGPTGPWQLSRVLTRGQYVALTADLLGQTVRPCLQCLADAQMRPEQIDEVLIVGGQSRAPGVVDAVRRVFGKEPSRSVDPEESVAMGAAIQTGIRGGEVKDLVLLDVTPHTLGIETKDGSFTPLIERNSTIPTRKTRVFSTVADNQTRVELHVLQGESDMSAYNKSLAKFELTDIPAAAKGKPQIEVGFEIDVNGTAMVEATDLATGRRQAMRIHPSSGLDRETIARLAQEARARTAAGRETRERESLRRRLQGLVANAFRSLQALEDKLTAEEAQGILDAIGQARTVRESLQLDELKASLTRMERAAGIIGQAMLRP